MVDTVYNIVEKDINLESDPTPAVATTSTENSSGSNCEKTGTRPSSNSTVVTTSRSNRQNSLLRDLIRIILLNEIISRRQNPNQQMMMQNGNMNSNMFI